MRTWAAIAGCVVCSCAGAQTVYFSKGFTTNLYSSMYSGSAWPAGTLVKTMPNEGLWVQGAICPTRDEVALAQTDYDSRISILFKVNGTWGSSTALVTNSSFTTMRKFAVTYERLSGDCLVAYSTGSTNKCNSRSAASGTLATAVTAQTSTNYIDLVRLYSKPASDEVLLATADGNNDLYASIWNGSSWGSATAITTSLPASQYEPFDAVYQASSGTAMIVYSEASVGTPKYRTKSNSGWNAAVTMGAIPSAARWIKLAAHPTSNNAVAVMIDAGNRVHAFTWNGTAWTGPTTVTTTAAMRTGVPPLSRGRRTVRWRCWCTATTRPHPSTRRGTVPHGPRRRAFPTWVTKRSTSRWCRRVRGATYTSWRRTWRRTCTRGSGTAQA